MRKRFEQQLTLGIKPISETQVLLKCRDDVPALVISLLKIYNTPKYNKRIFITKMAWLKIFPCIFLMKNSRFFLVNKNCYICKK
jgi:hypothetical protein